MSRPDWLLAALIMWFFHAVPIFLIPPHTRGNIFCSAGSSSDDLDLGTMENPHAERQAVLLERILKNTVSKPRTAGLWSKVDTGSNITRTDNHPNARTVKSKCTEMILELNRCLEVS